MKPKVARLFKVRCCFITFPGSTVVKNLPARADTGLGFDPWIGKIPRRREWQPSPVFLSGKFH